MIFWRVNKVVGRRLVISLCCFLGRKKKKITMKAP